MKRVLLSLLMIAMLSACGKEREEENNLIYRDLNNSDKHMTKDGLFFMDQTGKLLFFDSDSKKTVYVCDQAECSHEDDTCKASCSGYLLTCYGNEVYYFCSAGPERMELRARGIDGNKDRSIAEWSDEHVKEAIYWDGKMYCVSYTHDSEEFNAETGEAAGMKEHLVCVSLETGDVSVMMEGKGTNYLQIYDAGGVPGVFVYDEACFYKWDTEIEGWTIQSKGKEIAPRLDGKFAYTWGDYCYGCREEEGTRIFYRQSILTGKQEDLFENENLTFTWMTIGDRFLYVKTETGPYEVYFLEAKSGKVTKVENDIYQDIRVNPYIMYHTEYGVVLDVLVDTVERVPDYYSGTFAYWYITFEGFLEGRTEYTQYYCAE